MALLPPLELPPQQMPPAGIAMREPSPSPLNEPPASLFNYETATARARRDGIFDDYRRAFARCVWDSRSVGMHSLRHHPSNEAWLTDTNASSSSLRAQACSTESAVRSREWRMLRVGPLTSTGGFDWHSIDGPLTLLPLPGSADAERRFLTATFFAPTDANGEPLSYPPIHFHHGHVRLDPFDQRSFSLFMQSHGDTPCRTAEGGEPHGLQS